MTRRRSPRRTSESRSVLVLTWPSRPPTLCSCAQIRSTSPPLSRLASDASQGAPEPGLGGGLQLDRDSYRGRRLRTQLWTRSAPRNCSPLDVGLKSAGRSQRSASQRPETAGGVIHIRLRSKDYSLECLTVLPCASAC